MITFTSALLENLAEGEKKKTGNLPMGFLMEKHSTCKNQNIWWECVDFNVFLMGFSCKCAQFLPDVLPAWLSVVQAQQLSTWWPSRACRMCGEPAAPGFLTHRGTKHIVPALFLLGTAHRPVLLCSRHCQELCWELHSRGCTTKGCSCSWCKRSHH